MTKSKSPLGLLALVLLLALALPAVSSYDGKAQAQEQDGSWKNLSILYTTDCKGKIEPCG
jgi:2',3'-cyclic-nucleotide 2'-phosphodiesterase (5'-nucleotidase family)